MNRRQRSSTWLGIAAAVVLAANGHAVIINVPGDQPTIQAGILNAVDGDVVIVAEGEYFKNINFKKRVVQCLSSCLGLLARRYCR